MKKRIRNEITEYDVKEAYRELYTNIRLYGKDKKTIQVTSIQPGEGKTTLAFGLAEALSKAGEKVLFLDCDMRKSKAKEYFNIKSAYGLSEVLKGSVSYTDGIVKDLRVNLDILTAGEPTLESTSMLESANFSILLDELKLQYDRIILDSLAYGALADAKIIATNCDSVILALEEDKTREEDALKFMFEMKDIGVSFLGVVLTKVTLLENRNLLAPYYDL